MLTAFPAYLAAAGGGLSPSTLSAWHAYVAATEYRRANEEQARSGFLVMDFQPGAASDRRAVLEGQLVAQPMAATSDAAGPIEVPAALVHHWRGAVLLPGVTVSQVLDRLEYSVPPTSQRDVLRAEVLSRRPGAVHVFLRLRRQKFVTVYYNTEHDVTFVRSGPTRGRSMSVSTKIAELRDVGTPEERELPPGNDRGFLWRLNAYWRYQAVPGGVIAECESVSLSRDIPFGLGTLVGPLIASAARESMEQALETLRQRFEG